MEKVNKQILPKSAVDFYREDIIKQLNDLEIKHPNQTQWLKSKILAFCSKRLSTGLVTVLEELYQMANDAYCRKLVARKIHSLQVDYLMSFKEYSDRRLIMLAERQNIFDKWEGIYILGCFGGDEAQRYLEEKKPTERNPLFAHVMQQAILKIKRIKEKKRKERGF